MSASPKPGAPSPCVVISPEVWAQALRDYLAGCTASAVSKHYGMRVDAVRKRASKERWRQARRRAAPAA